MARARLLRPLVAGAGSLLLTVSVVAALPAATAQAHTAKLQVPTLGDPTETDIETSTGHWAMATASYDASGRISSRTQVVTAGDHRTTTTTYVPANGGPLTEIDTTNALGQSSSSTFDPRRGATTESNDVAGHKTDATYDALGRVVSVWAPGQTMASSPATKTYSYQYGPTLPLAVTAKTLVDPGDGKTPAYTTVVTLYDAFGQPRQTQTDAVGGGRVMADSINDSHGWVIQTNTRWYTTGSPSMAKIETTAQTGITDSNQTAYDGAGRPTQVTEYKGTTATWASRTVYSGDSTTVVPPAGGIETTTMTDARGSTVEQDQWKAAPTINSNNTLTGGTAIRTTYLLDVLGRQTSMTSPAGSTLAATWTTTYDLAARVVTRTDPDTGHSVSGYDDADEQISNTDANGTTLDYTYDALGRKTGVYQQSITTANQLAGWTYDTIQAGKLSSYTSYTAGGNYTIADTAYDTAGNLTATETDLPASETGFASSYQTAYTWTSTHLLATETPSAANGALRSETITHHYDAYGDNTATDAYDTSYVSASSYSVYGEANQYTLGVNNQRSTLTYNRDAQTRRITATNLSSLAATPQLENTTYTYDASGNVVNSVDTQGGAGSTAVETQCYRYDAVDRLVAAWSATDACASDPATAGNAKVGGPQSYWTSWTLDDAGERTQQVSHAVPAATGGITTTSTTNYTDGVTTPTTQAHALASSSTSGGTAGTSTYSYDNDGDTTTRTTGAGTQTITYTPDSYTKSITSGTSTVSYIYDADGNELVRHDPTTTTVFLPGEDLTRTTSTAAISGVRYYTHNGTIITERLGFGVPIYLYADPHGTEDTAVATTQAGTATPVRRHYDPYGNALGTTTGGTWPTPDSDFRAFLNKPQDVATGLDELGARQYDPVVGRFLSVDPLLEIGDAAALNGYSYADDNPTNASDPSGLRPIGADGSDVDAGCWGTGVCTKAHYLGPKQTYLSETLADYSYARSRYDEDRTESTYTGDPGISRIITSMQLAVASALAVGGGEGSRNPAAIAPGSGTMFDLTSDMYAAKAASQGGFAIDQELAESSGLDSATTALDAAQRELKDAQTASDAPAAVRFGGESQAAANGRAIHSQFDDQLRQLSQSDSRWQPGLRSGLNRPDGFYDGDPIELKPNSPSGLSAGRTQLRRYIGAFGAQRGYLYTYNESGSISMNQVLEP